MKLELLLVIALPSCLVFCSDENNGTDSSNCVVQPIDGGKSSVKCSISGGDGEEIDQVLEQQRGPTSVAVLNITAWGNVTLKAGGLRDMPLLEKFVIKAKPGVNNAHLILMSPDEFRHTPRLGHFEAESIWFPGSTLSALFSLENQLTSLSLASCEPGPDLLRGVTRFTRLEQLVLRDTKKQTLSSEHFRGLGNLKKLEWSNDKVMSIDAGTFDDLVNVEVIDFSNNQLRGPLPQGLFSRNTKLTRVNLRGNAVTGLTQADFAHCPNFQSLEL